LDQTAVPAKQAPERQRPLDAAASHLHDTVFSVHKISPFGVRAAASSCIAVQKFGRACARHRFSGQILNSLNVLKNMALLNERRYEKNEEGWKEYLEEENYAFACLPKL
jgi:hypothetical protein